MAIALPNLDAIRRGSVDADAIVADEENVGDVWWNGPLRLEALGAEDYVPALTPNGDLSCFAFEWLDPAIGEGPFELDIPIVIARVNAH